MNFSQKWFIETTDGRSYRLLIKEGYFSRLLDALSLYSGEWYAISTTGILGREKDIINSITLKNRVTMKINSKDKNVTDFCVINRVGKELFSHKNIRIVEQRAP